MSDKISELQTRKSKVVSTLKDQKSLVITEIILLKKDIKAVEAQMKELNDSQGTTENGNAMKLCREKLQKSESSLANLSN